MISTPKSQLYNAALKEQALNPVGLNKNIETTHSAEGFNASCGDEITLFLALTKNQPNTQIKNISFETESCAICRASASLLCQTVIGLNKNDINDRLHQIKQSLTGKKSEADHSLKELKLEILAPIKQFPSRVNCALLPWETLMQAFNEY